MQYFYALIALEKLTSAASTPRLQVVSLKAYYFTKPRIVQAVDNINFQLSPGETLGIVGESGCGKSSLGSTILRSIQYPGKIVEGRVMLNGIDLVKLPRSEFDSHIRWKKIAMIFQGAMNALDPVFSVQSQMQEILKEHGYKGSGLDLDNKIIQSLKQVDLDVSIARKYPHQLSGGEKQRVVIAMALLLNPDILIADEPTTAVDVLVQSHIIDLLKKLRTEKGISIILISHDLALVSQIADKIAIMYAGQLIELGSVRDIFLNPKHPYTQALISAIPRLHAKDKKIRFIPGRPPSLINLPTGCRFYERCPHAMDICKKDPPKFQTHDDGYVHCWLYDDREQVDVNKKGKE